MRHCDRHSIEERDALFVILGTPQRIALGLSCHPQLVQAEPPGIGRDDAGRGAVTASDNLVDGTAKQLPPQGRSLLPKRSNATMTGMRIKNGTPVLSLNRTAPAVPVH